LPKIERRQVATLDDMTNKSQISRLIILLAQGCSGTETGRIGEQPESEQNILSTRDDAMA
jgi:hypothetical protein